MGVGVLKTGSCSNEKGELGYSKMGAGVLNESVEKFWGMRCKEGKKFWLHFIIVNFIIVNFIIVKNTCPGKRMGRYGCISLL